MAFNMWDYMNDESKKQQIQPTHSRSKNYRLKNSIHLIPTFTRWMKRRSQSLQSLLN